MPECEARGAKPCATCTPLRKIRQKERPRMQGYMQGREAEARGRDGVTASETARQALYSR